jgi:hypothetical protein
VGPLLARHTQPLRVSNGRLEVAVPGASWRNQLGFLQAQLVTRLNLAAQAEVISAVVLLNRQPRPAGASDAQPRPGDKETPNVADDR